jgi:ketosteroid isomerase-like protein
MEAVKTPTTSTDRVAVVATALDYFEGWFDGDVARMERALHPNFVKRRAGEELGITTKERMRELTRRGEGKDDGTDRTLDVEVEDVYGDIASATVHSAVYHEYLHLVRTHAGWKIANALWRLTGEKALNLTEPDADPAIADV